MTNITSAMVLAAGLGKRMLPITNTIPKPLVPVAGRTLLDRGLDSLQKAGVTLAVVNIHWLGNQIRDHLANRGFPRTIISDESERLLDSGGGVVKALPDLGTAPFFVLNADTFWLDCAVNNLEALGAAWDPDRMDILLMLADPADAIGHGEGTDFLMQPGNHLERARNDPDGLIYAGAAIIHPRIFNGADAEPHSLNRYFDGAIDAKRLFGHRLQGTWITVGTPDAIAPAEEAVRRADA